MTVRDSPGLFIGGRWSDSAGPSLESTDPGTGALLWRGATASADDIGRAVTAARQAFPGWSDAGFEARRAIIERFRAVLERERAALARLIADETGKPRWDSAGEVGAMIGKIAISIDAFDDRTGHHQRDVEGGRLVVRHLPHGVMAVFGPFNFPGHLPNGHIVPALLAGNTVVFKPSELTPAVAETTVRCWERAGLPAGVINLVQGEVDTARTLAAHPGVDGLLFTGSARTGQLLHRQFGEHPEKILALEMGGNNPLVVLPTERIDAALTLTLLSAYLSAGQRCTCARRLIVAEGDWGDDFVERLAGAVKRIRTGLVGDDPEPFIGPLVSARAAAAMLVAERRLADAGARVLVAMNRSDRSPALLSPGLVDMSAAGGPVDEEFFGPLLQIFRHRGLDHAIELANDTRYGLAAGMIGGGTGDFERFVRRCRAGIVNWNRPTTGASSAAPFGGVGASGNHRPSAYYAADYCAYPVASSEADEPAPPAQPPGLSP